MTDVLAGPIAEFFANPLVTTGITLVGVVVVALWLAAAWWAYQDAARRSESTLAAFLAAAWIVVSTPLMLPLALAVYGFARPQLTAADHRTRSLVHALGAAADGGPACASCQSPIEASWLRCPACSSWLAAPCRSCGVWSARDLEACPFCGSEDHASPVVEPAPEPLPQPVAERVAAAVAVDPGGAARRGVAVRPGVRVGPGLPFGRTGHGTAAAGVSSAAAVVIGAQERVASSTRPFSYATSRDSSSASS
jgi:RNA polymerase subunit RPABC4/transcription elongation factor Spt4